MPVSDYYKMFNIVGDYRRVAFLHMSMSQPIDTKVKAQNCA
jgi:hypothetical protein